MQASVETSTTEVIVVGGAGGAITLSVDSTELQVLEEYLAAQQQQPLGPLSEAPTLLSPEQTLGSSHQQAASHTTEPIAMATAVAAPMGEAIEKEAQFLGKEQKAKVVEELRSYGPGTADPGVRRIVGALQRVISARTMAEHREALRPDVFADDLVWDGPPILLRGRDTVRAAVYLFPKSVTKLEFEPELVEAKRLPDLNAHMVTIIGNLTGYPLRTWLVPPTLLLPKKLQRKVTVKVGVNGSLESGKIELVHIRMHNVPELPTTLRALNGFVLGNMALLTEPIWRPIMGYLRGEERPAERPAAAAPSGEAPPMPKWREVPPEEAEVGTGAHEPEPRKFPPTGAAGTDEGGTDIDYGPDDIGIQPGDYKITDASLTRLGYIVSPGGAIEHIGGAGPGWDSL